MKGLYFFVKQYTETYYDEKNWLLFFISLVIVCFDIHHNSRHTDLLLQG